MLILWIRKYFIQISMISKVIEGHKSSSILPLTQPFPYWIVRWFPFPLQIVCISLSLSHSPSRSLFFSLSLTLSLSSSFALCKHLSTQKYDLKGHIRPHLCRVIFKNSQIFWSNYNLNLCSNGQLLSLFKARFSIKPSFRVGLKNWDWVLSY